MKLTGNEVLAHYEALGSVAQLKMGGRLAVAIMSNIKILEPHFKAVVETIEKIHKENKVDSDKIKTELEELGEQEINDNKVIVYTSADSVLQICGNENHMGLETLYKYCEIARELTLKDEWRVGRVIARPYVGEKAGELVRTSNRHDYALKPTNKTAMDALKEAGFDVIAVGKISDIFDGEGVTESVHSKSSVHGMEQTIEYAKKDFEGFCFTNLVDFDALWGHRRNPVGYAEEIERFDKKLGELLPVLRDDDLLIITADHGNDPTYTGTDHTREKVPFIAYSPSFEGAGPLSETDDFATIGATIADNFGVKMPENTIGQSVLDKLK